MQTLQFLLALFSLSQSPNLVKLSDAPVVILGFWRLLGAMLILFPFFLLQVQKKTVELSRRNVSFTFLSAVFLILHFASFFWAAKRTSVAHLSLLFSLNPIFTALITTLVFKIPFKKTWYLSILLGLLGVVVLLTEKGGLAHEFAFADYIALLSCFLFSCYFVASHQARKGVDNIVFSFTIFTLSAIAFGGLVVAEGRPWLAYSQATWLSIAGLIIFPTLLGHFLMSRLMKLMSVNVLSCGKLIEPCFATLGAYWLFGESISTMTLVAFFLMFFSLLTLIVPGLKSLQKDRAQVESLGVPLDQ